MSILLATVMVLGLKVNTMEQVVDAIRTDQVRVGEVAQRPLSHEEIGNVDKTVQTKVGIGLPDEVKHFLTLVGGIDYNGAVIYGGAQSPDQPGPGGFWQGILAANLLWRNGASLPFLVIGETDMDILTVGVDGSNATLRDKVSHDVNERFHDVGTMITEVLRRRL